MKRYDLRIRSKQERDAGLTLFDEYVGVNMELIAVGVDEAATVSGKTGLVLVFRLDNQQIVRVVSVTAAAYLTIAAGLKGAMERFGDPWEGT